LRRDRRERTDAPGHPEAFAQAERRLVGDPAERAARDLGTRRDGRRQSGRPRRRQSDQLFGDTYRREIRHPARLAKPLTRAHRDAQPHRAIYGRTDRSCARAKLTPPKRRRFPAVTIATVDGRSISWTRYDT